MAESWRLKDTDFLCSVNIQLCPLSKTSVMSNWGIWSWIQNDVFRCLQCCVPVFQTLKSYKDFKASHINEAWKKEQIKNTFMHTDTYTHTKQSCFVLVSFFNVSWGLKIMLTSAMELFCMRFHMCVFFLVCFLFFSFRLTPRWWEEWHS